MVVVGLILNMIVLISSSIYIIFLFWKKTSTKNQKRGKYDLFIKKLQKKLIYRPDSHILWDNLGLAYYVSGELNLACDAYKKALETSEDSRSALLGISDVYVAMEEFELALEFCYQAFKGKAEMKIDATTMDMMEQALVKPYIGDEHIWHTLSSIYAKMEDYEQAITAAEKALEINPKLKESWLILASIYNNIGEHDKAIDAAEKALEIDAKEYLALGHKGYAYYKKGNKDSAFELLNKAISLNPKSAHLWYLSAVINLNMKNYDKALEAVDISLHYRSHDKVIQKLRKEIIDLRLKDLASKA
ncbi:MAG: tetratricopeptide repeat protein [Promethearchaeota archaeon]